MDYPHTQITSGLSEIAKNSTRWGAKASALLAQYRAKRTYWTSRIAELEAASAPSAPSAVAVEPDDDFDDDSESLPEYPHTSISKNLSRLRTSLKSSNSPERGVRLGLLDAVESDYGKKRAYLDALMSHLDA